MSEKIELKMRDVFYNLNYFALFLTNNSKLAAYDYLKQGKNVGQLEGIFRAFWTFFRMYFLRLGFLDGYDGFLLAALYGTYTLVKYAKLQELKKFIKIVILYFSLKFL